MDMSEFANTLDNLIRKYREVPFSSWEKVYLDGGRPNDYAPGSEEDPKWWQAHTDVLEIVTDPDGRKWANVLIVLYPRDVHSLPPALSVSLAVYDDGQVEGVWVNGDEFEFAQERSSVV